MDPNLTNNKARFPSVRFFSVFLLVSFLAHGVTPPVCAETAAPAEVPAVSAADISIPRALGDIEELSRGTAGETVVLIRDAHSIPEAQSSIERLIEYVHANYGAGLVGTEGAATRFETRIFRSFPDGAVLRKVLEDYLARAELTGASAAALAGKVSPDVLFHGIEDWKLYEEGHRFFLDAMTHEDALARYLAGRRDGLERRKREAYSPELFRISETLDSFHANRGELAEVLRQLGAVLPPPKSGSLDLMLQSLTRAAESPEDVKFLRSASAGLRKKLEDRGDPAALASFNEKYQAFQTSRTSPGEFAAYLENAAAAAGVPVFFPGGLSREIQRHRKMKDIEGTKFFDELEDYERAVKERLFRSEAERALDGEEKDLRVLSRLAHLELGWKDWQKVKDLKASGALPPGFDAAIRFYENAVDRDAAMFENLSALMKRKPSRVSILVAGGFHSRGLLERLAQKGISCVLVTPAIRTVPEQTPYRSQMVGRVSWDRYLKDESGRINLYDAFVRGFRDSLLAESRDPAIVKPWRDGLLRTLADERSLSEADGLLGYLDELAGGRAAKPSWETKIDGLIAGLRALDEKGRFDQENILHLLRPSTYEPPVLGAQLARGSRFSGALIPSALTVPASGPVNAGAEPGPFAAAPRPGTPDRITGAALAAALGRLAEPLRQRLERAPWTDFSVRFRTTIQLGLLLWESSMLEGLDQEPALFKGLIRSMQLWHKKTAIGFLHRAAAKAGDEKVRVAARQALRDLGLIPVYSSEPPVIYNPLSTAALPELIPVTELPGSARSETRNGLVLSKRLPSLSDIRRWAERNGLDSTQAALRVVLELMKAGAELDGDFPFDLGSGNDTLIRQIQDRGMAEAVLKQAGQKIAFGDWKVEFKGTDKNALAPGHLFVLDLNNKKARLSVFKANGGGRLEAVEFAAANEGGFVFDLQKHKGNYIFDVYDGKNIQLLMINLPGGELYGYDIAQGRPINWTGYLVGFETGEYEPKGRVPGLLPSAATENNLAPFQIVWGWFGKPLLAVPGKDGLELYRFDGYQIYYVRHGKVEVHEADSSYQVASEVKPLPETAGPSASFKYIEFSARRPPGKSLYGDDEAAKGFVLRVLRIAAEEIVRMKDTAVSSPVFRLGFGKGLSIYKAAVGSYAGSSREMFAAFGGELDYPGGVQTLEEMAGRIDEGAYQVVFHIDQDPQIKGFPVVRLFGTDFQRILRTRPRTPEETRAIAGFMETLAERVTARLNEEMDDRVAGSSYYLSLTERARLENLEEEEGVRSEIRRSPADADLRGAAAVLFASALDLTVSAEKQASAVSTAISAGPASTIAELRRLKTEFAERLNDRIQKEIDGIIAALSGLRKEEFAIGYSLDANAGEHDVQDFISAVRSFGTIKQVFVPTDSKLPETLSAPLRKDGILISRGDPNRPNLLFGSSQEMAGLVASEEIRLRAGTKFVPVVSLDRASLADTQTSRLVIALQTAVALLIAHEAKSAEKGLLLRPAELLRKYELFSSYENTVITSSGGSLVVSAAAVRAYLEMRAAEALGRSA